MATGSDIAKAGWLYRLSSVLHRWKKNWFVLYRDGDLRYFENPDQPRAEERIVVRAWVTAIKTGPDCRRADPPEGHSHVKNCYLELIMRGKDNLLLCAESFDDMRAWQIALEEARTMTDLSRNAATVHVPPPGYSMYNSPYNVTSYPGYTYPSYPYQGQTTVVRNVHGNTTVVMPPSQQVVYVDDNPYRYSYRRGGHFMGPVFWW